MRSKKLNLSIYILQIILIDFIFHISFIVITMEFLYNKILQLPYII